MIRAIIIITVAIVLVSYHVEYMTVATVETDEEMAIVAEASMLVDISSFMFCSGGVILLKCCFPSHSFDAHGVWTVSHATRTLKLMTGILLIIIG